MGLAPEDPARQQAAVAALEEALAGLPEVDEEGHLANAIVEHVEADATLLRVAQICEKFALTERTLQRLPPDRAVPEVAGPAPAAPGGRWRLAAGEPVARIAGDLGYGDQAHLTRDFRAVTGWTPGAFAAEPRARD